MIINNTKKNLQNETRKPLGEYMMSDFIFPFLGNLLLTKIWGLVFGYLQLQIFLVFRKVLNFRKFEIAVET